MMIEDDDILREFLVESHENLTLLDQEMVELEQRPGDAALLASVFRTFHTLKGTAGFLGFSQLERLAHRAENLLSQLRNGDRELTPALVTLILDSVDAIRAILRGIENKTDEVGPGFEDLLNRLQQTAAVREEARKEVPDADESRAPAVSHPAASASGLNAKEADRSSAVADATIRVGVALLDRLMDLVGELVLTRNQILQFDSQSEEPKLHGASQKLNLITSELQEGVMKTRMQPIGVVWGQLPRVVRDIAAALGKQIDIEMDGAGTELDKTIIEAVKDPILHLVRNCCDHGIELPEVRTAKGKPAKGRLTLKAWHEGGQVIIEVSDNGAGIDVNAVRHKAIEKGLLRPEQAERMSDREALGIIFLPGLSTAHAVTNVSGRGVGMDVVKSNIEKIGGTVEVQSVVGQGTTLQMKIPLTLAIIPGLVVTAGKERFLIPQASLLELIRIEQGSGERHLERIDGVPTLRHRGQLLPIVQLSTVLHLPPENNNDFVNIVVLRAEEKQFGLIVDDIHDTQEIVVKPLAQQLKGLTTYAGATIMGDGRVALILDVVGVCRRAGLANQAARVRHEPAESAVAGVETQSVLLVRSGAFERLGIALPLISRLEKFPKAMVERAAIQPVVQYRGGILSLISLNRVLSTGGDTIAECDPVPVIVFQDGERTLGLAVDEIVDICEDEMLHVRRQNERPGILGTAVIGGQVTDLLDLHAVLASAAGEWLEDRPPAVSTTTVLLAEPSAFSRALLREGLQVAGHRVLEAEDEVEALRLLDRNQVDVLATAIDLPPDGCERLIARVRGNGAGVVPVVALGDKVQIAAMRSTGRGLQEFQNRYDWRSMVESVERLADALQREQATQLEKQSA